MIKEASAMVKERAPAPLAPFVEEILPDEQRRSKETHCLICILSEIKLLPH